MSLYDDVVEVPRRTMVLFFLVDTSGSMYGTKIGTVNTVPTLERIILGLYRSVLGLAI